MGARQTDRPRTRSKRAPIGPIHDQNPCCASCPSLLASLLRSAQISNLSGSKDFVPCHAIQHCEGVLSGCVSCFLVVRAWGESSGGGWGATARKLPRARTPNSPVSTRRPLLRRGRARRARPQSGEDALLRAKSSRHWLTPPTLPRGSDARKTSGSFAVVDRRLRKAASRSPPQGRLRRSGSRR